ncbi:MAG: hypothetical protein ACLUE8_16755 [Lachnospiraceae bacterium]
MRGFRTDLAMESVGEESGRLEGVSMSAHQIGGREADADRDPVPQGGGGAAAACGRIHHAGMPGTVPMRSAGAANAHPPDRTGRCGRCCPRRARCWWWGWATAT